MATMTRKKPQKKPAAKGPGKAAARRPAKAGAKKAGARKKPGAAKTSKKAAGKTSTGPFPVKTGKGATAREIGTDLVASFNSRTPDEEIWKRWFSPQIQSIEGDGTGWRGMKGLKAKSAGFHERFIVHNANAEGPYVGGTGFAVKFTMEMEDKTSGERHSGSEIGVYTIKNGKVVQEEFMYGG